MQTLEGQPDGITRFQFTQNNLEANIKARYWRLCPFFKRLAAMGGLSKPSQHTESL
jgi:hypothetical protein